MHSWWRNRSECWSLVECKLLEYYEVRSVIDNFNSQILQIGMYFSPPVGNPKMWRLLRNVFSHEFQVPTTLPRMANSISNPGITLSHLDWQRQAGQISPQTMYQAKKIGPSLIHLTCISTPNAVVPWQLTS